jgi:hypothetical protein
VKSLDQPGSDIKHI